MNNPTSENGALAAAGQARIVKAELPRAIFGHEATVADSRLSITATDQPNYGAHHEYDIHINERFPGDDEAGRILHIGFQLGPIGAEGSSVNGITNECLLAIVADRLRCFQSSFGGCRENALALTKIEEALHWLHARTRDRQTRGVEGTRKV